jgi:hypothetical protein
VNGQADQQSPINWAEGWDQSRHGNFRSLGRLAHSHQHGPFVKRKEYLMNTKTEGTLAIVAAIFVLFSAMWDARISAAISVLALVAFGIYKFAQRKKS